MTEEREILEWIQDRSDDWLIDELSGYWSQVAAMELRRRGVDVDAVEQCLENKTVGPRNDPKL